MHPYEVAQMLRSRVKHESVRLNYGSLYGVVEGLERRGLIRARETLRDGRRPERTVYEITEAGTSEASEWLCEMLAVPAKEYPQFAAGLSFMAALPPDEVAAALRARAAALDLRLVQSRGVGLAARAAGQPRLVGLESEYEERIIEAELRFVRGLLTDIETGLLDGLELWRGGPAGEDAVAGFVVHLGEAPALPKEVPPADAH
jgi:DNA-binding PadR family transcriptional regulator